MPMIQLKQAVSESSTLILCRVPKTQRLPGMKGVFFMI